MTTKVIVITGVSRGLGRTMTEGFVHLGHRVLGCGRSEEAIQGLNNLYGPNNHFEVVDVTNEDAVRAWAKHCLNLAGSPDLLINNAALVNRNAPLWKVPASEFSLVVDVNIRAPLKI